MVRDLSTFIEGENWMEGPMDYNLIECPYCGDEHLHHENVEIFDRTEDAEVGRHVIVNASGAHLSMEGNPSNRRSGVKIRFSCEGCDKKPELFLVQHKGETMLYWNPRSFGDEYERGRKVILDHTLISREWCLSQKKQSARFSRAHSKQTQNLITF
jgi:hypothetical protein